VTACPGARRGARRGATLAELLVAAAVGGVVSTAAVVALVRVRRSAAVETERALARAQLAQAAGVLAHELRGAALAPGADDGGDLLEARDTAVDVRAAVGGSVACAAGADGAGSWVALAPAGPGAGWWAAAPRAGDAALVHDPGALPGAADDAWRERAVLAADAGGAWCAGGPYAALGAGPAWRLALAAPALPATAAAGAPVRVVRRRRYALYRGGDGLWALGVREWDAGGPQGVQPLAGPFEPPEAGGMRAAVRDSAGAVVAPDAPGAAEVEVRLLAVRRRLGAAWRDSAGVRVRPAGAGGRRDRRARAALPFVLAALVLGRRVRRRGGGGRAGRPAAGARRARGRAGGGRRRGGAGGGARAVAGAVERGARARRPRRARGRHAGRRGAGVGGAARRRRFALEAESRSRRGSAPADGPARPPPAAARAPAPRRARAPAAVTAAGRGAAGRRRVGGRRRRARPTGGATAAAGRQRGRRDRRARRAARAGRPWSTAGAHRAGAWAAALDPRFGDDGYAAHAGRAHVRSGRRAPASPAPAAGPDVAPGRPGRRAVRLSAGSWGEPARAARRWRRARGRPGGAAARRGRRGCAGRRASRARCSSTATSWSRGRCAGRAGGSARRGRRVGGRARARRGARGRRRGAARRGEPGAAVDVRGRPGVAVRRACHAAGAARVE
jgi:type II secretory pathway pseudopilin PulG